MGFRDKLLRNKPSPLSPEQTYLGGRATADLTRWRSRVSPILHEPSKDGSDECPYQFGNAQVKAARTAWLTGFYDEIVDQAELRCRKALGLEPKCWVPPPESKIKTPKGGPG